MSLLKLIRGEVQRHLAESAVDEQRVLNEVASRQKSTDIAQQQDRLNELHIRLRELETLGSSLYEDRLNGVISVETFRPLSANAESEREKLTAELATVSQAVMEAETQSTNTERWLEQVRKFLAIESPDRETIHELIDKIVVGANEGTRKNKIQNVTIYYRFVGCLD